MVSSYKPMVRSLTIQRSFVKLDLYLDKSFVGRSHNISLTMVTSVDVVLRTIIIIFNEILCSCGSCGERGKKGSKIEAEI